MLRLNPFNRKIGVALGGGAAKGIAHIGVLKAFDDRGVEIDYIAGTSVGAIIATYYAFGKNLDQINDLGDKLKVKTIMSLVMDRKGFMSSEPIRKMILEDIGDVDIEDANIPLGICTTDIIKGESVVFTSGKLVEVICASIAVPGIFAPVEYAGRILVDGGITQNVPVYALEQMGAGITVGVNLNSFREYPQVDTLVDIVKNAFDIAIDQTTKDQLKSADIDISIDLRTYSRLDNSMYKERLINEGYLITQHKLRNSIWINKLNYFFYIKRLIKDFVPFKIPAFVSKLKEVSVIYKEKAEKGFWN